MVHIEQRMLKLMLLVAIGLSGQKLGSYSNPLASALKTGVGHC